MNPEVENKSDKIVIFDFDGTIADTFDKVVELFNSNARKYRFHPIEDARREVLRGMTARELFRELRVPVLFLPFFVRKVKSEMSKVITDIEPFPEMVEVLNQLHAKGCRMWVLTSNSEENVKVFLKKYNLEVFESVYSESTVFHKDKLIKKLLKQNQLKNEDVIYIGDEVRDAEACKRAEVKIISVSWGFNSRQVLEKHTPDFLIDRPNDMIPIFKKLGFC